MISRGDQLVVNLARSEIKDELMFCEFGSYEDHIQGRTCMKCVGRGKCDDGVGYAIRCPACKGSGSVDERQEPYDKGRLHIVELIQRDKSKTCVHLDSEEEISEFFVQACTGTFGLYHLRTLQRIYKQLEPFVAADVKGRISYGSLGY